MEIIAATRQGTQVYIYEDCTFRKTREVKDRVYVRCCVRGCPSTAVVKDEEVVLRRPHNHEPETTRIEKLRLREDLRNSAMKHGARQNMRRIFEETCVKHSPAALIDYKSIRSSMYRAKRLKDFPIPTSLGEYSDVLAERDEIGKTKDDPPQPFFQRYIEGRARTSNGEKQWSAVIFISPTLKPLLASSSTIHIDASTKAVPKDLGERLLTIHVLYMEHLFPVVYVLINGSPEDSFSVVLNEVVAICPETRQAAQFIITDYDLALMNAAYSAWPNASVAGCFFHFAQDIFRKHITYEMRPIVLGNDTAKTALQMIMALPLLPPGLIVDGLHEIHQYLIENGLQAAFSQLVEYVEEYWMTTVGPHNISVFQQMHRTNNGIAGFYFYLLSKMGSNRTVWQYTDVLLAVEHTYTLDYTKLLNGRVISTDRRKGQRAQDLGIEKCWKGLNDKGFHLLSCLINASHAVDGLEERVKELMRVEGNPPPIVVPVFIGHPSHLCDLGSSSSANGNSSNSAGGEPSSSEKPVEKTEWPSSCTTPLGNSSEAGGSTTPNRVTLGGSSRSVVFPVTTNEDTSVPAVGSVTSVGSCNSSMNSSNLVSGNLIDSAGGSIVNLSGSPLDSHLNSLRSSSTGVGGSTTLNSATRSGRSVVCPVTSSESSGSAMGSVTSVRSCNPTMGSSNKVSGLIDSGGGSIVNLSGSPLGSHLNTLGSSPSGVGSTTPNGTTLGGSSRSMTPLGPSIINRAPVSIFWGHNQQGYRI